MKAATVTNALQSRAALAVAMIALFGSSYYVAGSGVWVNFIIETAIIALMIYINKVFSIPRTITLSYAVFFAAMQTATPEISTQTGASTVLCLIVGVCMLLMFSSFSQQTSLRRIFLVFFLLSTASTVSYAFLIYIPVFILGCAQMRIFSFRSVSAMILGIITPWWILMGLGIISPGDINLSAVWNIFDTPVANDRLTLIFTALLTAGIMLTAYALSWLKLMTYNASTRGCNGLLSTISFVTVIAMAIDFNNFATYLTLLNFCAAFMLGHAFVIRNSPRAWISYVSIVIVYYAIYLWRIIV